MERDIPGLPRLGLRNALVLPSWKGWKAGIVFTSQCTTRSPSNMHNPPRQPHKAMLADLLPSSTPIGYGSWFGRVRPDSRVSMIGEYRIQAH